LCNLPLANDWSFDYPKKAGIDQTDFGSHRNGSLRQRARPTVKSHSSAVLFEGQ